MSSTGSPRKPDCSQNAAFSATDMSPITVAETILVVDECEMICELIELLLIRDGYHVRTAASAVDAMRIAHEMPEIDVVLCGLELRDMPGEELAIGISALHPTAAIVFVSASYKPNDLLMESAVLEKPFRIRELRSKVRSALRTTPAFEESTLCAAL
jgi:DNA-binding response OmpR family regulator